MYTKHLVKHHAVDNTPLVTKGEHMFAVVRSICIDNDLHGTVPALWGRLCT